jgi:ribonuclease R
MKRKEEIWRDKMIFTIDGADSKDFDDAVSIDVLENGIAFWESI